MALLLDSDTSELMFPFEENKRLSSSIKLRNTTENHVAFKIKCTEPRRYVVQPCIGILSPGGSCDVTVKTRTPRRAPTNVQTWHSRDIFKIQSVLARPGTTKEDAPNLFNTAVAHMIEESILQVVYTIPQDQVAAPDDLNSTEPTSEVDEPGSIVEPRAPQGVPNLVRDRNIHIGALILKCFICTFIVVVSYYLMKHTCSLIRTLTQPMVMLMMKMVTKLVTDSIEDWVAKTLICLSMPLVYKYKESLRGIMLRARVWDRVMGLTNGEIKFIQMLTN